MKYVIVLVALVLVGSGCVDDGRVCVKSHTETGTTVQYNVALKMSTVVPYSRTVCDEWEYETVD